MPYKFVQINQLMFGGDAICRLGGWW